MHILYENVSWQLATENAIKQILMHILIMPPFCFENSKLHFKAPTFYSEDVYDSDVVSSSTPAFVLIVHVDV
jgi:hypothetical protein